MTNLEKYRSLLHDGVQGLLLTSRYSRMYAAEFDIAEGVAVVSAQGARYFTDSRYIESAQKNLKGFEVVEIGLNNPMMQALKTTLDEFGVETIGFEDEYLTVAELNGFEAALPVKFVPLQKEINAFRASKEDWELARMRKAQEITDRASRILQSSSGRAAALARYIGSSGFLWISLTVRSLSQRPWRSRQSKRLSRHLSHV